LGFYINLDCVVFEDKSYKYRITKEYYKYDKPEFEKEYFDTLDDAQREFDILVEEFG
jgi:hypothetical protein